MEMLMILLNGAFNAFVIGMSTMIMILICAAMFVLEQSIAEVIQENHEGVTKHPHIMSICIIVLTAVVLCLLVKLVLMILPLLWSIIKLVLICGAIIFVLIVLIDLVSNLFTKK